MNLGISKELNYNLYSNSERAEQVRNLFTPELTELAMLHFNEVSTQHELETIANFILYGKDPKSDKNFCQKKEIQIKRAHRTYEKKEPESLDALLEETLGEEVNLSPLGSRPVYKKTKPTIDREKDKDIPGMQDLWVAIDKLAAQVSTLKENNELGLEYYRKNHVLIALRKEQFTLKDMFRKEVCTLGYHCPSPQPASLFDNTGYLVDYKEQREYSLFKKQRYADSPAQLQLAEFGLRVAEGKLRQGIEWEWKEVSENHIDLSNPKHVYQVIEHYSLLKENSYEQLSADTKYLLWELEDLIEKAKLSPARFCVLVGKIDKLTNAQISEQLQLKFGLYYSDNYISTIFVKMICERIAKTAELERDSWVYRNDRSKFKKCSRCGRTLLRDLRNFVKKSNAADGLTARCKDCDKEVRQEKFGLTGDRV